MMVDVIVAGGGCGWKPTTSLIVPAWAVAWLHCAFDSVTPPSPQRRAGAADNPSVRLLVADECIIMIYNTVYTLTLRQETT